MGDQPRADGGIVENPAPETHHPPPTNHNPPKNVASCIEVLSLALPRGQPKQTCEARDRLTYFHLLTTHVIYRG